MPTKGAKPPGEKKRLSYERDRRNTYGENNKSSRKAIPKFKATTNRTMRHATKQALVVAASGNRDDARLADRTFKGLHPSKKKIPDLPLGAVLKSKAAKGWKSVRHSALLSKARQRLRHGRAEP